MLLGDIRGALAKKYEIYFSNEIAYIYDRISIFADICVTFQMSHSGFLEVKFITDRRTKFGAYLSLSPT